MDGSPVISAFNRCPSLSRPRLSETLACARPHARNAEANRSTFAGTRVTVGLGEDIAPDNGAHAFDESLRDRESVRLRSSVHKRKEVAKIGDWVASAASSTLRRCSTIQCWCIERISSSCRTLKAVRNNRKITALAEKQSCRPPASL